MNGSVVLWRYIAAGSPGSNLYQEIVGWATEVKSFGEPLYFTVNHEPEASASGANGTPEQFIAAWRRSSTCSASRTSASKVLGASSSVLCMSERVNLASIGSSTRRLRTAGDAGIARVFINSGRRLAMRSDITGAQLVTTRTFPLGAWRTVELCGDTTGGGTMSLYLEGASSAAMGRSATAT